MRGGWSDVVVLTFGLEYRWETELASVYCQLATDTHICIVCGYLSTNQLSHCHCVWKV